MNKYRVLLLVLGLACQISVAMKRGREEGLEVISLKQQKVVHEEQNPLCLQTPLKEYNVHEFKLRLNNGADPNQVCETEPLFFDALWRIDSIRSKALQSQCDYLLLNTQQSKNEAQQSKNEVEKNEDKIKALHECLGLLLRHKKFNAHCEDMHGVSAIETVLERTLEPLYGNDAEEILPAQNEDFILKGLLEAGVSANKANEKGFSLLHLVALHDKRYQSHKVLSPKPNLKAAEILITYNANINAVMQPDGNTPLHLACNDVNLSLLLLAKGADFKKKNAAGKTAAELSENPLVIDLLTNVEQKEEWLGDIDKIHANAYLGYKSPLDFIRTQETGLRHRLPDSSYADAIKKYTNDLTEAQIMYAMGYQLRNQDNLSSISSQSDMNSVD